MVDGSKGGGKGAKSFICSASQISNLSRRALPPTDACQICDLTDLCISRRSCCRSLRPSPWTALSLSLSRMASQLPIYGNFQRYYHIRNPTSSTESGTNDVHPALRLDSRLDSILAYLDQRVERVRDVLDIGCNSGRLTIQLSRMLQFTGPVSITGVDIDASLIKQAKDAAATARSLCRPWSQGSRSPCSETCGNNRARQLPLDSVYFPSVFPQLFGFRPEEQDERPTKVAKTSHSTMPASGTELHFVAAEWVSYGQAVNDVSRDIGEIDHLQRKDVQGYDLVLALSLTKWVHIHSGDTGIARFFARVSRCLRPNGILILEPQDWRSYDAPKRMSKAVRDQVQALQMRPQNDFHWLLTSVGLIFQQTIGMGVGTGFTRPLQVFCKPSQANTSADVLIDALLGEELVHFPWVTRAHNVNSDAT